uniref:Uncharacterized protein LOC111102009 n=1 Tax=Crassostrea virginica TaxID=6565 RepID=A0A8B8AK23_CRAVI|nr:uncharacterized protein LOC111102009 [Crassostrea virginica]
MVISTAHATMDLLSETTESLVKKLTISILALSFLILNAVMPVVSKDTIPRLEYVSVNQDKNLILMGKRALTLMNAVMEIPVLTIAQTQIMVLNVNVLLDTNFRTTEYLVKNVMDFSTVWTVRLLVNVDEGQKPATM